MEWSENEPSADGYYWVKLNFGLTKIVYIFFCEYEGCMVTGETGDDEFPSIQELFALYDPFYYGPLEQPKE